ncbi:MAG TPA: carboxypeptidase-like regulatory domain-containing protein [Desulfuromonadaceae bacterium]|jgi:hypothetical protein
MRRVLFIILVLTLAVTSGVTAGESMKGKIKGVVQSRDGKPLSKGMVYFFNEAIGPSPMPEKYWRVPDVVEPLDDAGTFAVELPAGTYFIGAILRKGSNEIIGPPSEGDLYYAGTQKYWVNQSVPSDAGIIKGADPFSRSLITKTAGITALEGYVIDEAGKPVENAMVFAHKQSTMNDRPLFVSERTNRDGAFRLRVGEAGSYYLRIRDIYGGGAPEDGAFMGAYGGKNPKAVTVKTGEVLRGIKLNGEKFVRPKPGAK